MHQKSARFNKLSTRQIHKIKRPGYYPDGAGLYLQVAPTGAKTWILRYMLSKKAHEMGLGSLRNVPLQEAREKRTECIKLARDQGVDPIVHRRSIKFTNALSTIKKVSFDECAESYIAAKAVGWKNPKHRQQWVNTIAQYASPVFGKVAVSNISTEHVMNVLRPIWHTKAETASRLRGRIQSILDWAKTSGYRDGDNPARWSGHLQNLLPSSERVRPVQHHSALPYQQIHAFIENVKGQPGQAAKALEFLILTASRTGEVIGAMWSEFDLPNATWTIPAERMKMNREHRVPLTASALDILSAMQGVRQGDYVFANRQGDKPISNMAMLELLKRMQRKDITVHGFRSTFRDWAAHETNIPREIAEAALAHDTRNPTEAAYQRGDLFNKRRQLMQDWEIYCKRIEKICG